MLFKVVAYLKDCLSIQNAARQNLMKRKLFACLKAAYSDVRFNICLQFVNLLPGKDNQMLYRQKFCLWKICRSVYNRAC